MKCDFIVVFVILIVNCCFVLGVSVASESNGQLVESTIEKNAVPDQIAEAQEFYEVDAFGDDFIDFGAETGAQGAYQWHASYPIHRSTNYAGDESGDDE